MILMFLNYVLVNITYTHNIVKYDIPDVTSWYLNMHGHVPLDLMIWPGKHLIYIYHL